VRRLDGAKREVEILFSDNGPGIPEHVQSEIWNPFFTTKPLGKGTGLGLSISHGIILEHGGTIAIAESRAGVGTTFRIVLPCADVESSQGGPS
jgi:signal transduction histidine kinase